MNSVTEKIYLASNSPRRHEILLQMGIEHDVLIVPSPPGDDEPRLAGEPPELYVQRTALDKSVRARQWLAQTSHPHYRTAAILTADTTVILANDILGKPANLQEAKSTLKRLSGATHHVHTAVVLAAHHQKYKDISITSVRFKKLSDAEIQAYCATGEPLDKAGSYGIQGYAASFIEHISGSYSGVMGLPIFETNRLLQLAGLLKLNTY